MATPITFNAAGFRQAEQIQRRGQANLALLRSAGRGLNLNESGLARLIAPAVSSTTSLNALRAAQAISERLEGSEGTDLLQRLAPQLIAQQTVSGLLTGGGFTLSEQSSVIAGGLKSQRGAFLNLQA